MQYARYVDTDLQIWALSTNKPQQWAQSSSPSPMVAQDFYSQLSLRLAKRHAENVAILPSASWQPDPVQLEQTAQRAVAWIHADAYNTATSTLRRTTFGHPPFRLPGLDAAAEDQVGLGRSLDSTVTHSFVEVKDRHNEWVIDVEGVLQAQVESKLHAMDQYFEQYLPQASHIKILHDFNAHTGEDISEKTFLPRRTQYAQIATAAQATGVAHVMPTTLAAKAHLASLISVALHQKIFEANHGSIIQGKTWPKWLQKEAGMDTISVAINEAGSAATITGNMKTRLKSKKGFDPQGFGLSADRHGPLIKELIVAFPALKNTKIELIDSPPPAGQLRDHNTNAAPHAEHQNIAYNTAKRPNERIALGISRSPCNNCLTGLTIAQANTLGTDRGGPAPRNAPSGAAPPSDAQQGRNSVKGLMHQVAAVAYPDALPSSAQTAQGSSTSGRSAAHSPHDHWAGTNWRPYDEIAVQRELKYRARSRAQIAFRRHIAMQTCQPALYKAANAAVVNMAAGKPAVSLSSLTRAGSLQTAKAASKNQARRLGRVHSPGDVLENLVENFDRQHDVSVFSGSASGTYRGRVSIGAVARAAVWEHVWQGGIFSTRIAGPNAAAGAHAGLGGLRAYAQAEAGSIGFDTGVFALRASLNVNTGVNVSANGLELSFLGFGLNLGPKLAVKLPVGELACTMM
jgi:hypothetical protein